MIPESTELQNKERVLHDALRDCGSVVIGFSGGVDSAYLCRAALDALGRERVLAVTGLSPSHPAEQREMARRVARAIGLPHLEIETRELDDPRYAANPTNRCYFCKSELFQRLDALARERGYATVIDGSNADDLADHRPGSAAAEALGVRAPLQEAGLTKGDIRALSRAAGLPTWDLPAAPCLASRLVYGLEVTPRRLRQIEAAEARLKALACWSALRVRHHGDLARLEVGADDLARLADPELRRRVGDTLRDVGFARACLDLEGYRRGALNETGTGPPASTAAGAEAKSADPPHVQQLGVNGDVAVIRATDESFGALLEQRTAVAAEQRAAGFRFVALALDD